MVKETFSMTKENISIPKETFSLVKETPSLVVEMTFFDPVPAKLDAWMIWGNWRVGSRGATR